MYPDEAREVAEQGAAPGREMAGGFRNEPVIGTILAWAAGIQVAREQTLVCKMLPMDLTAGQQEMARSQ